MFGPTHVPPFRQDEVQTGKVQFGPIQPFSQTQAVHPQTLKAFVGVEMEENEPDDEWKTKFSVFERRTAKISRPE